MPYMMRDTQVVDFQAEKGIKAHPATYKQFMQHRRRTFEFPKFIAFHTC